MTGPHFGDPDPRLTRWATWLTLSGVPAVRGGEDPFLLLKIRHGQLIDPATWPTMETPRIYLALDIDGPVYVGQTSGRLSARIRRHFGSGTTLDQKTKIGSWEAVVSAAFDGLRHGELAQLELSAVRWVLPLRDRRGRHFPKGRLREVRRRPGASQA